MVITVGQDSPNHHFPPTHASPSINAAEPKAASRRAPCDMPLIYARPRAPGKRTQGKETGCAGQPQLPQRHPYRPRPGRHRYDGRGREKHTAACTAPRCGFSADYDSRAAAELAARTHRCPIR